MSAYLKCLEHMTAGNLPAIIPIKTEHGPSIFAVASSLDKAPRTRAAAYSPNQAARLAAAFVVIHEARKLARQSGYTLTT